MRTRKNKNKTLLHDLLRGAIIGLFAGALICISTNRLYACTYEEALNGNWNGYDYNDVVRILNEDMTKPSTLAYNQKRECLLEPMKEWYKEFDKVSDGIKYEALVAISAMETGHFTSNVCAYNNNVGGMRNAEGYMTFYSKEEGIKALSELLTDNYLNEDGIYYEGKTIVDVGQHYNQSAHWVQMYVKIRLDMEKRIEGIEPEEDKMKKELSEEQKGILRLARETYGSKNQLIVSAEECNELAIALLKFIRYEYEEKGIAETYGKVLEERADVEIVLNHIDSIYKFSEEEILDMMAKKIERLKRWVNKTDSIEYTTVDRGLETPAEVSCEDCFYFSHFDEAVEKCINCVDYKTGYNPKGRRQNESN